MRHSIVALALFFLVSGTKADVIPPDVHYISHSLVFTNYNEFSNKAIFHSYPAGKVVTIVVCDSVRNGILNNFYAYGKIYTSNNGDCHCSGGYPVPYEKREELKIEPSEYAMVPNTDPRVSIIAEYEFYYDSTVTLRAAIQKKTVKFSNGKADSVITYPKPSAIEKSAVSKNLKQPTVKYANGFIDYTLPSNEPSTLTFWNPAGKKIAFVRVNNISGRVMVPAMASGNYLAVLESQKFKVSTKLVVKH
jgi:hypothetical protein